MSRKSYFKILGFHLFSLSVFFNYFLIPVTFLQKVRLFILEMNKCLNCGKEIPEGRKFCSSSCSAKYNNVRRQRRPWTEEQHRKNRKERPVLLKEEKIPNYMKRCASALGVEIKDIPETLRSFYWDRNYSVFEFWYRFQIPFWILQKVFRANSIAFRDAVESQKVALEEGRKSVQADEIHFKTGHHTTWEGLEVFYRSSYELEFAQQLDEQKVSYRVENLRIRYFDSQQKRERVAVPDFYLPETNEIVEIKSSWTYDEQLMKDKFKAYREAGYVPRLILDKKEINGPLV